MSKKSSFFIFSDNYRFSAYKQYTCWILGHLGKNVRVPLPSCAIDKIHHAYPSYSYRGFQMAEWYPEDGSGSETDTDSSSTDSESDSDADPVLFGY